MGGWDANMKMSQGKGGTFGFFNAFPAQVNILFDNFELLDGAINDSDIKTNLVSNV